MRVWVLRRATEYCSLSLSVCPPHLCPTARDLRRMGLVYLGYVLLCNRFNVDAETDSSSSISELPRRDQARKATNNARSLPFAVRRIPYL